MNWNWMDLEQLILMVNLFLPTQNDVIGWQRFGWVEFVLFLTGSAC